MQIAARYDAEFLASRGHDVCIVTMSEHEARMLDAKEFLPYLKTEKAKFLRELDSPQR
jgi:hypothetical protein